MKAMTRMMTGAALAFALFVGHVAGEATHEHEHKEEFVMVVTGGTAREPRVTGWTVPLANGVSV